MDNKLTSEVSRRFKTFENLEESIKTRQAVLENLQTDAEDKSNRIDYLKENSRKMEIENVDIEFKRKKLGREIDSLTELCNNLKRDNTRISEDILGSKHDAIKITNKTQHVLNQLDQYESLNSQVFHIYVS